MPTGGTVVVGTPQSHRGRCSYGVRKADGYFAVGAPAPGANAHRRHRSCRHAPIAPRAVLLRSAQGRRIFAVGAPAPGANTRRRRRSCRHAPIAPRAVLLRSAQGRRIFAVGAPAPGANTRRRHRSCRHAPIAPRTVLLVSLPECWLATNTLVGRKPVALLRAMTLRRRSGSDLSLNLYGIRALPKRDEAA